MPALDLSLPVDDGEDGTIGTIDDEEVHSIDTVIHDDTKKVTAAAYNEGVDTDHDDSSISTGLYESMEIATRPLTQSPELLPDTPEPPPFVSP